MMMIKCINLEKKKEKNKRLKTKVKIIVAILFVIETISECDHI